jgi:hypothetical protein
VTGRAERGENVEIGPADWVDYRCVGLFLGLLVFGLGGLGLGSGHFELGFWVAGGWPQNECNALRSMAAAVLNVEATVASEAVDALLSIWE